MTDDHIHRGSGNRYVKGCPGCKAKATEDRVKYRAVRANFEREARLRQYGLTLMDFTQMCLAQDGVCAICHEEPISEGPLHIDHDHITGKVRGLLCENCNRGLGMFRDNPHLLARAADYLNGE